MNQNRDDMTHKERMLAGLPYKAWLDGLPEEHMRAQSLLYQYNQTPPERWDQDLPGLLEQLLGQVGKDVTVKPPLRCDYGRNITIGDDTFINYDLMALDVAPVTIGRRVMIAPRVSIYTAGHPVHPDSRNSGYEYGQSVTIEDDVWIGGSVVILPGVTIGRGAVIGGGSVVTKDIPPMVIAVGSPCRVVRPITEEDRKYYYKDRPFTQREMEEF